MPKLSLCRTPLILCAILFILSSCGRKGPPKPPEDFAPLPVSNFNIQGTVDGVVLTWESPIVDQDKKEEEIVALGGFRVDRAPFKREEETDYVPLKEIALPEQKAGSENADTAEVASFTYTDSTVEPGKIYNYHVIPLNIEGAEGEAGQTVRVTFLGENSRIEKIVEISKRPDRETFKQQKDEQELAD